MCVLFLLTFITRVITQSCVFGTFHFRIMSVFRTFFAVLLVYLMVQKSYGEYKYGIYCFIWFGFRSVISVNKNLKVDMIKKQGKVCRKK